LEKPRVVRGWTSLAYRWVPEKDALYLAGMLGFQVVFLASSDDVATVFESYWSEELEETLYEDFYRKNIPQKRMLYVSEEEGVDFVCTGRECYASKAPASLLYYNVWVFSRDVAEFLKERGGAVLPLLRTESSFGKDAEDVAWSFLGDVSVSRDRDFNSFAEGLYQKTGTVARLHIFRNEKEGWMLSEISYYRVEPSVARDFCVPLWGLALIV